MASKSFSSLLGGIGYGYSEDIANNPNSQYLFGSGVKYSGQEDDEATRAGMGGIATRAKGGPVTAGRPYLVGERGPELMVPQQNGFVLPNRRGRGKQFTNSLIRGPGQNVGGPPMNFPGGGGEDQYVNPVGDLQSLIQMASVNKPAPDSQALPDMSNIGVGLPGQELLSPFNVDQSLAKGQPGLDGDYVSPIIGNGDKTAAGGEQKKGLYDDWGTKVFGNMPLDQFVQLTGMMANAVAPNEWSGRLGGNMAMMAGQANRDRMDYEERGQVRDEVRQERELERDEINKKYEEQRQEGRQNRYLDAITKTAKTNPTLARIFYDKWKVNAEQELGQALPEWDAMDTPTIMKEIEQFSKDAKELGLDPTEITEGKKAILNNAYGIKEEKTTESWGAPYEESVGGKKAIVQKSSSGKIAPVIQDKSTTITVNGDNNRRQDARLATTYRKEFNNLPEVQEYNSIVPKIESMRAAYAEAQKTNNFVAVDQALITLYNKLTDPSSVVRESEYARTAQNIPLLNQIRGKMGKILSGGAGLTNSERSALMRMANLMKSGYEDVRGKRLKEYKGYGKQAGLDDSYLIDPYEKGVGSTQQVGRFQVRRVQ